MDLHKPKPWRNAREFLKEYLTIVIGVLTALAAEQGAEWLHWQQLSARTERELTAGLQVDLVNAMERTAIYPCQREQIAQLAARLDAPAGDWKGLPTPPAVGVRGVELVMREAFHTPRPAWSIAAWQSALTSGALEHLPHDRVDAYARAYRLVEVKMEEQAEEAKLLPRLAALAYDHRMTDPERIESLRLVAELDRLEQSVTIGAGWLMSAAHEAGVSAPADKLAHAIEVQRAFRGACVREPAILNPPQR